jgi:hypothetical protein
MPGLELIAYATLLARTADAAADIGRWVDAALDGLALQRAALAAVGVAVAVPGSGAAEATGAVVSDAAVAATTDATGSGDCAADEKQTNGATATHSSSEMPTAVAAPHVDGTALAAVASEVASVRADTPAASSADAAASAALDAVAETLSPEGREALAWCRTAAAQWRLPGTEAAALRFASFLGDTVLPLAQRDAEALLQRYLEKTCEASRQLPSRGK